MQDSRQSDRIDTHEVPKAGTHSLLSHTLVAAIANRATEGPVKVQRKMTLMLLM